MSQGYLPLHRCGFDSRRRSFRRRRFQSAKFHSRVSFFDTSPRLGPMFEGYRSSSFNCELCLEFDADEKSPGRCAWVLWFSRSIRAAFLEKRVPVQTSPADFLLLRKHRCFRFDFLFLAVSPHLVTPERCGEMVNALDLSWLVTELYAHFPSQTLPFPKWAAGEGLSGSRIWEFDSPHRSLPRAVR